VFGAASNTIDWLILMLIDLLFPSRPLIIGVLRLSIWSIAPVETIKQGGSLDMTI